MIGAAKGNVHTVREATFKAPCKVWGVMRKTPGGKPSVPSRRAYQPHHGDCQGRGPASVPGQQAPIGPHEYSLSEGLAEDRRQLFTLVSLGNQFLVWRRQVEWG